MPLNIVIAGVGGQGVISLGTLIGEAAVEQGLDVWSSEVHGMAQRGGSVTFHLRMGQHVGETVLNPLVAERSADLLVGMDIMETLRNVVYMKPDGYILHSMTYLPPPSAIRKDYRLSRVEAEEVIAQLRERASHVISVDSASVIQSLGVRIPENMVMLGALSALDILPIDVDALKEFIARKWPKFKEQNVKAFEAGRQQVMKAVIA